MANVNRHGLFRAIQRVDPSVKEYRIHDSISYVLSEWTREGGHRRLVTGDLDSLNAMGMAMAEKNKGLFSVGGGCGKQTYGNFTGIDETDPRVLIAAAENQKEWEAKFATPSKVVQRGAFQTEENAEPEEECEAE